jgi:histidinol-phosphate aminotransferase
MDMKIKQWISNMPEYIPGRTIEEIKKQYNLKEVNKMASNENLYGPAPEVLEEICKNVNDIKYYPDSESREVRKKISKKYNVSTDSVIMGNGSDQIIEMICDSFIEPGENVIVADPTFLIYEKSALKCNGTVIKIPLKEFRQDIEKMVSSVNSKTRILFITSPHNPTGTKIDRQEFDYVMENVKNDVMIVIDEAYVDYMSDEERIDTAGYLSRYNNLIILRTFSKIYGLAGLRAGYGMSNPLIISTLNKIRLPFNVNMVAQKAAAIALENESCVNKIRSEVREEKKRYYRILAENKIDFVKSYANFILINTGRNSDIIVEELLRAGFIVRPGKNLGVPGYIRVTVALPDINEMFLATFVKIFSSIYKNQDVS